MRNLRDISEHISYEIEMFELSASRLGSGNLDQFQRNAFLETFILHARCLIDFLYLPNNTKSDDVVADHFFDNPENFHRSRPKLQSLIETQTLKPRAGKEIAHLTYKRLEVTPEMKIWQVSKIHKEINGVLATFFKCLSEEQRRWFRVVVNSGTV
jgi:hypothetical protein